jgi:hypothetical protein
MSLWLPAFGRERWEREGDVLERWEREGDMLERDAFASRSI